MQQERQEKSLKSSRWLGAGTTDAEELAPATKGVKQVRNELIVEPEATTS